MDVTLTVYAGYGRKRDCVGLVKAHEGMRTNKGIITRIAESGSVFVADRRFLKPSKFLTVWHTEARKFGYPHGAGCRQFALGE